MYKNGLIRKIRLISKFMTFQPGKQTIWIHILPNISKSKDNQTMKFRQLIEHIIRNIFIEKSCTKMVNKQFPDSFLKNQNWTYLWINSFIQFVFTVCQVEGYWNQLKLSCRPLAFTSFKAFLKNKKKFGTSLRVSFSA